MASLPLPGPGPVTTTSGLLGLDVVVGPVALVADDDVDVGRIALGEAVGVDPDAPPLELVLEDPGRGLVVEPGDDDGPDLDAPLAQVVDELHGVDVVGDAEIGPHLLPLDVAGVDAEEDIGLVLELLEEPHLDVGIVAGQDPGGVIVEEELAAEFEVELVREAAHPLEDGSLLFLRGTCRCRIRRRGHLIRLPRDSAARLHQLEILEQAVADRGVSGSRRQASLGPLLERAGPGPAEGRVVVERPEGVPERPVDDDGDLVRAGGESGRSGPPRTARRRPCRRACPPTKTSAVAPSQGPSARR